MGAITVQPASTTLDGVALEPARRRATRLLVGSAALGSTASITAGTVSAIVAGDLSDGVALAGAAASMGIVGAAVGAYLLSALMLRRGRRIGLAAGYVSAVAGAFVSIAAVLAGSFAVLLMGTFLIGFANSANQLSRYSAADMATSARRAWVIGIVVWAGTVGAILGPNLVAPAASAAEAIGLPYLTGPYLVPVLFAGAAALLLFVWLRPDPYALAVEHVSARERADDHRARPLRELLTQPAVAIALTAMVVGQVTMVVIMTMTPLHMAAHGHDLASVGFVISAHTAGMFALAPVSGRLTASAGPLNAILVAAGVLAIAGILAAVAPSDGGGVLTLALFLLGYGWNLGFVAGSSLIAERTAPSDRTRIEGTVDSIVWASSAVASLSSGIVLALAGFSALGLIGAAVLALPVGAVLAGRRRIAAEPGPAV
jgi:MFS family permease